MSAAEVRAELLSMCWAAQVDLGGKSVAGGIREALMFPGCADFQPLQYINGLADAIVEKYGGKIFEHSQVLKTTGKKVIRRIGQTRSHACPEGCC